MRGCESQEGAKPEARRARGGVLGDSESAPTHQLGDLGEGCKLPQHPGKFEIWCNLRP